MYDKIPTVPLHKILVLPPYLRLPDAKPVEAGPRELLRRPDLCGVLVLVVADDGAAQAQAQVCPYLRIRSSNSRFL